MKYAFEIFLGAIAAIAFISSAVISDVYPSWMHTQIALFTIGAAWTAALLIVVVRKSINGGYRT